MAQGLQEGTLLHHGKYRIIRILGQGGFGITYLAQDLSLDRKVAIKEFFPKDFCDRDSNVSNNLTTGIGHITNLIEKLKNRFLRQEKQQP